MSWTEIPGGMTTELPPAMIIGPDGDLFVFAVGTDQAVYVNRRVEKVWESSWTKIPNGKTQCGVYAMVDLAGGITVIITGLDGRFHRSQRSSDDDTWSTWESMDGGSGSSPTTIAGAYDSRQSAYVFSGNNKRLYTDGTIYQVPF